MKTSIKNLRNSMKAILDRVKKGEEVVIYSYKEPIAKIVPIIKEQHPTKEDHGFGMWADHEEMQNVALAARKLRKGRQHDI